MDIGRSLPAGPGNVSLDIGTRAELGPLLAAASMPTAAPAADWQRYVVAIARYKWFVLAVTLLGTAAGVVGAHFLPAQYAAKAVLWFETAGTPAARGGDRDVISGDEVVGAPGWVELVTSNTVLDTVVRSLRLYLQPTTPADTTALRDFTVRDVVQPGRYRISVDPRGRTFQLALEDRTVIQRGTVGDSVGQLVGFVWKPGPEVLTPGKQIDFEVTAPYDVVIGLAKRLKPRMDPGGSFLTIPLKGKDPELTAATVNAIAERMVVVAQDLKRKRFEALADILGGQYEHARAKLDSAENTLRNFQTRTAGLPGSRLFAAATARAAVPEPVEDPALMQTFTLRVGLDQLRRDRRTIEDLLRAAPRGGIQVDALASLAAVQQSPNLKAAIDDLVKKQADLRALRTHYTDESEPVQRVRGEIDSLQTNVLPALARDLASDLAARENVSRPHVDSAFGALRRVPTISLDESRLERDVASAEELATNVRQRYEAARLALVSTLPDVRILDAAVVPQRPAMSLAPLLVAMALITSFALAVLGILVRDGVDPKVRYPEQVTHSLRLPILGAVPNVGTRGGIADAMGPAIEALRGLRLRVLHAHTSSGPMLITISSPAMGEGKSFVSANLALSFADAGYRTLLIDGDVRRGTQHIVLAAKQRPGLTDVLAGQAQLEDAVRPTEYDGLTLLASGTRMHRAPELLLSKRLRETVDRLKGSYDVIIVDSPPLAAGADPLILATVTRNLLLVLRSGRTDLPLAISKLDVLESLPVRIIGAVLNDVHERGAFKYYQYDTTGYALPRAASVGGGGSDGGPHILVRED